MPRSVFLGLCLAELRVSDKSCRRAYVSGLARTALSGEEPNAVAIWRSLLDRLSQILPFQPRNYIHSQNSKTAHGIDESCPFLIGSTVALRKHQPPPVYFRLGRLNPLLHHRPIGFEQGCLI